MEILQVFYSNGILLSKVTILHYIHYLDPIYVFGSSNQGSDQARMTQLYQAVNSVEVIHKLKPINIFS